MLRLPSAQVAKILSLAELRKMTSQDLRKEVSEKRARVAALRLATRLGKEKGTHLLRLAKKELARMLTILAEIHHKQSSAVSPSS